MLDHDDSLALGVLQVVEDLEHHVDEARLVAVTLANRMGRIAWALMAKGGVYRDPTAAA